MTVVIGKPGAAYMCPVHGRFIPADLPRYHHDQPEAKCMAWVTATAYCGEYAPLAPNLGVFEIEPDPPDLADRQAERVVAHQRRERGESSPAWSSLAEFKELNALTAIPDPTDEQRMRRDLLLYGTCYGKRRSDGTLEHIPAELVIVTVRTATAPRIVR